MRRMSVASAGLMRGVGDEVAVAKLEDPRF